MKNKSLMKKTLINFVIRLVVWTLSFPAFFIIFYFVISRSDFQWVYNYSPEIYYNAKNLINNLSSGYLPFNVLAIAIGIWLLGFIIMLYILIRKTFSYINALSIASENILNKDVEYIELPKDFENLQMKINHLKKEAEKNEILARENEQKKNDLIVYLAHDLKTPLTSMIGYLSLLDEIKDMPKKQREKYIGIALDKSYRLEDLINELFDIARFNNETIVLQKEEINLNLMLEQLVDDFYPLLMENNKEVKLNYHDKVIIMGDSDKLARVFSNLIKNAISYSNDKLITIDVERDNDYVTITVSNKGKKIPKEELDKIFTKFYRLDNARSSKTGGSGLGLAISKEIVELHGGSINAESDELTKFIVKLPFKG